MSSFASVDEGYVKNSGFFVVISLKINAPGIYFLYFLAINEKPVILYSTLIPLSGFWLPDEIKDCCGQKVQLSESDSAGVINIYNAQKALVIKRIIQNTKTAIKST